MKTISIQKNLRFPQQVIKTLEPKANSLGMTFNEYVKYLVTKEAESEMEVVTNPVTIKAVSDVKRKYGLSNSKVINNDEDLNKFFDDIIGDDI